MADIASIAAIPSARQSATGAIHRAMKAAEKDAAVVANPESRDSLDALIDTRQQVLYTRAAAKIISASDEMTASLLDIRA